MKEDSNINPYDIWRQIHLSCKNEYTSRKSSYLKDLIPEIAVCLNVYEVLQILQGRFGSDSLAQALDFNQTIDSPIKNQNNGDWLKKSKMVGINVRTIGNFFNIIKYLLTISKSQNSIHILPIWEPGVVASLYGKVSWNINPEFYSPELQNAIPTLDSVEKQLKVVINLIHLMGKTVGMDVIPHTDRFSEITFLYPSFFEWVYRKDHYLVSVNTQNERAVEEIIWQFINKNGTANGSLISYSKATFFDPQNPILSDYQKLEILFGKKEDRKNRLDRRLQLMQEVLYNGYETLPVTMAPPYRNLHLNEHDYLLDEMGNKWYNYQFDKPEGMSRVFGPLTRYKFYNTQSPDSQELNFEDVNIPAWKYVSSMYSACQKAYNFDFMRGDMAHVQPRASGIPEIITPYYDPLKFIKNEIVNSGVPYFGFFAETFLAPPNQMGYGDETIHLEAIEADSTLGDLQGSVVGSGEFRQKLNTYIELLKTRSFAPNFTMITADKDDPRFDEFYKEGNHLRFFVGLFYSNMPSYMSLGFECRNLHFLRGKNEEYSKLYVFQIKDKNEIDKFTDGTFIWGSNFKQFFEFQKMKDISEDIQDVLENENVEILNAPSEENPFLSWKLGSFIFVANLDPVNSLKYISEKNFEVIYSSIPYSDAHECRIYKIN
jgi:hypothetical protein